MWLLRETDLALRKFFFWSAPRICPRTSSLSHLKFIDELRSISLSSESSRVIFADDVCRPIASCNDFRYVQDDIEAVEDWSIENFLNLDPSKCKYILISRKRTPSMPEGSLILGNPHYKSRYRFKNLGVLLSHDMSWSPHVQAICSKAKKGPWTMYTLSEILWML